jgi:intracellular sulfur oxidation DsrE/DsrF family protein
MIGRALAALAAIAALAVLAPALATAEEPVRIVFHVDDNDPRRMNMVLNNAANAAKHYRAEGRALEMEIVAYGPGAHMLRADTSPVAGRIPAMAMELEGLAFSVCGNTIAAMERKSGKPVPLMAEATVTPSGVVRLVELQNAGWAYVRP